jgi:hypothetical protein
MKSANLKGKTFAIALILVLTMSAALTMLPAIKLGANGAPNIKTYPGITVAPNPVGVGQPIQVIMFIQTLPPSQGAEMRTVVTGGWNGLTLTVTNPNGTKETLGPYETNPSGMYQVSYTPTTTGTYSFQFSFPGATVLNTTWGGNVPIAGAGSGGGITIYYNANFLPCDSAPASVTVQQAPVTGYTEPPLPIDYWNVPINAQYRSWYSISGPWLQSSYNATGAFNPYTTAPATAHIVYMKNNAPLNGLIGGDYGSLEIQRTTGFTCQAIINGIVYYAGVATSSGTPQLYAMNLVTGKQVWSNPVPISVSMGQILNWRSLQSKIEVPYLWSTSGSAWNIYNAQNGQLVTSFTGAYSSPMFGGWMGESPTIVLSTVYPNGGGGTEGGAAGGGTMMAYMIGLNADGKSEWIACWNATQAVTTVTSNSVSFSGGIGGGLPATIPWADGIQWNITFPYYPNDNAQCGFPATPANAALPTPLWVWGVTGTTSSDYIIAGTSVMYNNDTSQTWRTIAGFNAGTGNLMWVENTSISATPYATAGGAPATSGVGPCGEGYFTTWDLAQNAIYIWSCSTGKLLWTVYPYENDFAMDGMGMSATIAYGNLYIGGYDGYMHCISLANGTQLWDTISTTGGAEMPEVAYPFGAAPTIADGKVYDSTSKAYETEPLYRGHNLYCFDAYTGQQLWNMSGQMSSIKIVDGYLLCTNNYDSAVYCFGKGETATTVAAPMTAVTAGSNVVIQGTVTDQSPGATGTPAISDQWMTPWMQYLYQQATMPTNAQGVPVSIDAVDPNGNYIHLGNTTSDNTGAYSYQWTPPNIPGKYTIVATFASDNSYYGSCGETAATVGSPATTVSPTPTPTSVADMYFVPAIAGLAALIIVGLIVLALLMLRKRP